MPTEDPIERLARRTLVYADREGVGAEPFETCLPGLSVARYRRPTALAPVLYEPLVCLVLQGAKQAYLGKELVTFARGESLIVSLDMPTIGRVVEASPQRPYLALALRLDPALLQEMADVAPEAALAAERARAIAVGGAERSLIDAVARLFDLLDRPSAARILAPLVIREIHFHLLSAPHGAMLRRLLRSDRRDARIARAVAEIRARYATPLAVAALAEAAGMSLSSFHEHFRSVTGSTPLQFQKQIRLFEARRMIGAGERSVASAAYAVGYESASHFSRDYARLFGASPRHDLPSRVGIGAV